MYGLYTLDCANLDTRNTIISKIYRGSWSQSAYGVGGDALAHTFEYNDVYDCTNGFYTSGTPGEGCLNVNPYYKSPFSDFHLASYSQCKNAGDPLIEDVNGTRSDMGCYGGPGGEW